MKFGSLPLILVFLLGPWSMDAVFAHAHGSFRLSCADIVDDGYILHARCKTKAGSWTSAAIDYSECKAKRVANRNGTLVCSKGAT